jgi:hypothetical protein
VAAHLEVQLSKPGLRPTPPSPSLRSGRTTPAAVCGLSCMASSQLSATRRPCLWPLLAAWLSQRKICGRLKRAASTKTRRREIGCREKIPAHLCAGDDPPLPLIGPSCWPRCQQIHAIAEMLHGRRDGRKWMAGHFHPRYSLYPHFPVRRRRVLSSGVCVRAEAISSYRIPAPHNQRPASQRLPRPRPDCETTARHQQLPPDLFACTGISKLEGSRSQPVRNQMER